MAFLTADLSWSSQKWNYDTYFSAYCSDCDYDPLPYPRDFLNIYKLENEEICTKMLK
jgi:hypothetical protein